ncbi:DUF2764 family protein [uncultured Draconibacterium sp.]|uniref:DUF2764 family protein n=1 Tax=uncultured Draconibacterium sp. TaxID=1573823 RepID=UPI0032611712
MLKREYHCLIAGLPDLFFDENKSVVSSINFREELQLLLIPSDYKLVNYLFLPLDNQNLLNSIAKKQATKFYPGTLSRQALEQQLAPENEDIKLPAYMLQFLNQLKTTETKLTNMEAERLLNTLFFQYALRCPNAFLQQWFRFTLNIKNVLCAFNCQKHHYKPETQLIDIKQVEEEYTLLTNYRFKADYFEELLPFAEDVFRIAETDIEMIEKEKAIDKLKWHYLEENTFFHFFTIERVLAFTIKLQIMERWMMLDNKTGKELLKKIMHEIKSNYEFPAEFSLTK